LSGTDNGIAPVSVDKIFPTGFLALKRHFWRGDRVKKYGILESLIKREFKTLGTFSRESAIPKSTLSKLIGGKYGSEEGKAIKRVGSQLKRLRPNLDISHIWDPSYAWYQKYIQEKAVVKNGFRIIVDIKLNEDGGLIIAPFVEGY
jgi:hypothetical protein